MGKLHCNRCLEDFNFMAIFLLTQALAVNRVKMIELWIFIKKNFRAFFDFSLKILFFIFQAQFTCKHCYLCLNWLKNMAKRCWKDIKYTISNLKLENFLKFKRKFPYLVYIFCKLISNSKYRFFIVDSTLLLAYFQQFVNQRPNQPIKLSIP